MDDLKRCPFCGGDPRMIYDLEGAPTGETFERVINEITERWNKTAERDLERSEK